MRAVAAALGPKAGNHVSVYVHEVARRPSVHEAPVGAGGHRAVLVRLHGHADGDVRPAGGEVIVGAQGHVRHALLPLIRQHAVLDGGRAHPDADDVAQGHRRQD
eukprot:CAMPEP_0198597998 /NCGR_PEP_ID=MMETSP1462-20131121/145124_1 /TAXON_ID=1333877 /ORGANISM="Brandtodinium nutriculum, Strain RCC3387" /LENGTH=103 /DNA_ID=CAMNT_0044329659 /DNA_START=648 /DNA_END=956 /DNA_ORIENTATION=+